MANSAAKTKKKANVFKKIVSFFKACFGEIKKISWPGVRPTTRNFLIVIFVIVIIGLFIFGLDRGLYALLGLVMETAGT